MAGDHGLSNLRFDGYDNQMLVEQVDGLRNGVGPGTLSDATAALMKLAGGLADTDKALREQLANIGVSWQGEAAEGGTTATENASIYAEQSQQPVTDSAKGVESTTAAFAGGKNSAPDSGTLNGPTEQNGIDQFMGFLGHTTDHAKQVKETNAARQQAIDAMNNYQQNSVDALNKSSALPVPPGMNLNVQPVDTGTHVSSVGSSVGNGGGGGFNPSSLAPGGATAGLPGGGGGPGGGGLPTVGGPGQPVTGAPPITGGGPLPGNPSFPSTTGPLNPALRAVNPLLMADAATAIGAGTASGAGAGADGERVSRTGGGAQRGPIKNGVPLGTAPEEEARAARNAERFGARSGRPGSSIMQPAAAGRNQEGEDDSEHVRRYGVESSDVFDDERVVAPESIGDDDDQ